MAEVVEKVEKKQTKGTVSVALPNGEVKEFTPPVVKLGQPVWYREDPSSAPMLGLVTATSDTGVVQLVLLAHGCKVVGAVRHRDDPMIRYRAESGNKRCWELIDGQ